MESFGYLTVQVLNASGALPVENALVKIESADEYDRIEALTDVTDIDGKTEIFAIPAPKSAYSLTPTPEKSPSSAYKVSVFKDGFYSRAIENIFIFENIYTTLTVPLVPNSLYNESENRPSVPEYESEDII